MMELEEVIKIYEKEKEKEEKATTPNTQTIQHLNNMIAEVHKFIKERDKP
jgi:prefoldin subunit 5